MDYEQIRKTIKDRLPSLRKYKLQKDTEYRSFVYALKSKKTSKLYNKYTNQDKIFATLIRWNDKMKKTLLTISLIILSTNNSLACTQEEASTKMQALYSMPEYSAMLTATNTAESAQKVIQFNEKMNEAGSLNAQGKHEEACKLYDEAKNMLAPSTNEAEKIENSANPTVE